MMNHPFLIRSYSKCELALLYSPDVSPKSAVNRLARWIKFNPSLEKALEAKGYRTRQQVFTPAQVAVVVEYLGEP